MSTNPPEDTVPERQPASYTAPPAYQAPPAPAHEPEGYTAPPASYGNAFPAASSDVPPAPPAPPAYSSQQPPVGYATPAQHYQQPPAASPYAQQQPYQNSQSSEGKSAANLALIFGILGVVVSGLFAPFAIWQASKAEKLGVPATAGKVLGYIGLALMAVGILALGFLLIGTAFSY